MRRGVGLSAGFLALIAIVVHSVFRPEAPVPAIAVPHEAGASEEKAHISLPGEPTEVIEGPWLATREFFHTPEQTTRPCKRPGGKGPNSPEDTAASDLIYPFCDVDGDFNQVTKDVFGIDQCAGAIHVIIATVPDPVRSRLALTADRQIETIERALQAAGWEFALQWLPWNDIPDPNEGNVSRRRYERYLLRLQQQLPGVLVFRKAAEKRDGSVPVGNPNCLSEPKLWDGKWPEKIFSRESLLVFVVGETPTAGINGRAFRAARKFAAALMGPKTDLGILAPSFSGSFYSLTTLLSSEPKDFKPRIHVYNATASLREYGELFQYHTGIKFRSAVQNSTDFQKAFCGVLDQHHIDHNDAANLVEDETGFGQAIVTDPQDCSDVRTYNFPRDISHLRNAYREAESEGQRNPYDPLPGVEFSVRDPQTGEDSIPVYSRQQTPQSQNAILEQITEDFNRRRVRLVNISATNVLDLLFLAHVIRVESPDTRVLISDAEVLFIPAVTNASMAGALFLSPYPMMLSMSGLRPSPPPAKDHAVTFADGIFEGLFNSIQFLLRDMNLENAPRMDYGHAHDSPDHAEDHPPLWLLTVNRYGYFPIERIRLTHSDHDKWVAADPRLTKRDEALEIHFLRPARSWMLLEGSLGSVIILFCLLLFQANRGEAPGLPMWMKLKEGAPYFEPRCLSLISVLFVMSTSQWILALPATFGFITQKFDAEDSLVVLAYVLLATAAFIAPLLLMFFLIPAGQVRSRLPDPKHRLHLLTFFGLALAFACLLIGWTYCSWMSGDETRAEYFNVRSLEIYSGSSPAVPILILLGLFFFVALSHFRRYSLGALNEPYLPLPKGEIEGTDIARFDIEAHVEEVKRQLARPIEFTSIGGWVVVACVGAFFILAWALLHRHAYFSAFEQRTYDTLLQFSELAAFALLALGCVHIVRLWNAFEVLLAGFESTVYMEAITRITRSWPRRPIWASGKFIRNPAFERQSLLALHNRNVISTRQTDENGKESKQFSDFYQAVKCMREACTLDRTFGAIFSETRKYYRLCCSIAQEILHDDLYPYWLKHVIGERTAATATEAADDNNVFLRASADFVVLQMARYFVFVAVQIQRIAWTLSITMVLLLIAFNTYSVQAPQTVGRVMAACFVVIGFFVVRVFAGLERNPILSRIAGTRPGKLTWEFYTHIAALGILPLIGVLAHLFPSISSFLASWVAPGAEALH